MSILFNSQAHIEQLTKSAYSSLREGDATVEVTHDQLATQVVEKWVGGKWFVGFKKWVLGDRLNPAVETALKAHKFMKAIKKINDNTTLQIPEKVRVITAYSETQFISGNVNKKLLTINEMATAAMRWDRIEKDITTLENQNNQDFVTAELNQLANEINSSRIAGKDLLKDLTNCSKNPDKFLKPLLKNRKAANLIVPRILLLNRLINGNKTPNFQNCDQPVKGLLEKIYRDPKWDENLAKASRYCSIYQLSQDPILPTLKSSKGIVNYIRNKYPDISREASEQDQKELQKTQQQAAMGNFTLAAHPSEQATENTYKKNLSRIISCNSDIITQFSFKNEKINECLTEEHLLQSIKSDIHTGVIKSTIKASNEEVNKGIQGYLNLPLEEALNPENGNYNLAQSIHLSIEEQNTKGGSENNEMPMTEVFARDCAEERFKVNQDFLIREEGKNLYSYDRNKTTNFEAKSKELQETLNDNFYEQKTSLHIVMQSLLSQTFSVTILTKLISNCLSSKYEEFLNTNIALTKTTVDYLRNENKIKCSTLFSVDIKKSQKFTNNSIELGTVTAIANTELVLDKHNRWVVTKCEIIPLVSETKIAGNEQKNAFVEEQDLNNLDIDAEEDRIAQERNLLRQLRGDDSDLNLKKDKEKESASEVDSDVAPSSQSD